MDERHPDRCDKVRQCETDVRPGRLTFKQQLLDIGEGRGDAWANDVALRMAGVIDLPTADVQYHQRCYNAYRKPLTPAECASLISDTASYSVIDEMDCNWKQTWMVADLYKLYQEYDGKLSSKHMMSNLSHYYGEQLMILRLEGCANVIGFRRFISRSVKLVAQRDDAQDDEKIEAIVCKIRSGVKVLPKVLNHYDLDQFTYSNTCESTSETLLTRISRLVSKEKKNKIALSISQCVQQHIALSPNQTTLGLAPKLHYKFGSTEIVRLTHEHGLSDGLSNHEEADVLMVSFMIDAVRDGKTFSFSGCGN